MACWMGSSHGRLQNCHCGQVSWNTTKKGRKECIRTLEGSFISKLRRCRVLQLRCRKVGIRLSSTLVRDSEQFGQWEVEEAYP